MLKQLSNSKCLSRPAQKPIPFGLLQQRDYTVILSQSNAFREVPGLAKDWSQAKNAVQSLSRACTSLDSDGITVHVAAPQIEAGLNCQTYKQVTDAGLSNVLFENYPPSTGDYVTILEGAISNYFQRKSEGKTQSNGEVFLIFLDGEPAIPSRLIQLISQTTELMEQEFELAIGFIQVGEDPLAQGLFQALDHDLYKVRNAYDIVHNQNIAQVDLEHPYRFLLDVLTS